MDEVSFFEIVNEGFGVNFGEFLLLPNNMMFSGVWDCLLIMIQVIEF